MNLRAALLLTLLGLPAVLLLAFGPRGAHDVPADRVVLRYWEKWTGVESVPMERIVERFNRTVGADEGIWVEYIAVSNVEKRTLIATAGGDPPDIAGLFDKIIPQFADQGALLPLDQLAVEHEIDLAGLRPIWLEICRYDGRLYALPSTPYTIGLYYNRRLFREAGLDPDQPPRTIAAFDECVRRLTRRDDGGAITQLGFTTSPGMLGWWHWVWPMFFDAQLWDGQRYRLDTPRARAAYDWIAARRDELGRPQLLRFEATAGAIEGMQNPFLAERLAMVFQGPWMSNWIASYAPELDYGVAPFPSVTAERRNVFASSDVFVIPRGARHPREALRFLRYLMRQDVLEELCRLQCKVSPFREPRPDFFAGHPNPDIAVFEQMADSPHAFGYPAMPMFAEVNTELLHLLENVIRGTLPPGQAVTASQQHVDAIVQRYQDMARRREAAP